MQSGLGPIAVPVPVSLAAPVHGCVQAPAPGICVSSPPRCSVPPQPPAPLRLWTACPIWACICSWFLCPHGPSHPPPSTPTCQRHDCPGCLRQLSQTSTSRQHGPTEDYSSPCGGCVPNSTCWRSRSPRGLWGRTRPRCVSPRGGGLPQAVVSPRLGRHSAPSLRGPGSVPLPLLTKTPATGFEPLSGHDDVTSRSFLGSAQTLSPNVTIFVGTGWRLGRYLWLGRHMSPPLCKLTQIMWCFGLSVLRLPYMNVRSTTIRVKCGSLLSPPWRISSANPSWRN